MTPGEDNSRAEVAQPISTAYHRFDYKTMYNRAESVNATHYNADLNYNHNNAETNRENKYLGTDSPLSCLGVDCNYQAGEIRPPTYITNSQKYLNQSSGYYCNTTTTTSLTTTTSAISANTMATNVTYAQPNHLLQQQMLNTNTAAKDHPDIYEMLRNISAQVQEGNKETAQLRQDVQNFNNSIAYIHDELHDHKTLIDQARECHNENLEQVDMLKKVVINQDHRISQLNGKIESLQAAQKKRNVLIWGIDETENEDPEESFKNFVQLKLEMTQTLSIKYAERRGKSKPRMLFVELDKVSDKYTMYKHAKNLKGKLNSLGKGYNIRDDLPRRCRKPIKGKDIF